MTALNPGSTLFQNVPLTSGICAGTFPQCYREAVTADVPAHEGPVYDQCVKLFNDGALWPADKSAIYPVKRDGLNCGAFLEDSEHAKNPKTIPTLKLPALRESARELAEFCFGDATKEEREAAKAAGQAWNVAGCATNRYTVTVSSADTYFLAPSKV